MAPSSGASALPDFVLDGDLDPVEIEASARRLRRLGYTVVLSFPGGEVWDGDEAIPEDAGEVEEIASPPIASAEGLGDEVDRAAGDQGGGAAHVGSCSIPSSSIPGGNRRQDPTGIFQEPCQIIELFPDKNPEPPHETECSPGEILWRCFHMIAAMGTEGRAEAERAAEQGFQVYHALQVIRQDKRAIS